MQTTIKKMRVLILFLATVAFIACSKGNNTSADKTVESSSSMAKEGSSDEGTIISSESERHGEYLIVRNTIQFADGSTDHKTYLITGNVESKMMGDVMVVAEKKYEVDCSGSCNCTEQWNPVTNIISCSCQPCKMTIKEVAN